MIDFKKIGFMQGRLVPSYNNQIQFFPHNKWEKELKVANHLRIRKVEWTINYKNLYKNPIFYKTKINKIKKIIKKNNINLNSVTCDFFMEKPFFKIINKNDKKKEINLLLKIIKHCRLLNINLIILPLLDNSSIASSSEEKELMRTLKLIQNYLGDTQMFLLESDYPPLKLLRFIRKFKSKKIGINYDTGNSAYFGYKLNDEKNYFSYVKNIHIKDRKFLGPSVRLGFGDVNFKIFKNFIKKVKYSGNLIFQTARAKNGKDAEELVKNINYFINK
jgi:sugar phosphate isomerase/epimerase